MRSATCPETPDATSPVPAEADANANTATPSPPALPLWDLCVFLLFPSPPGGAGGDAEGRGGLATPATDLPPHLEAEAIRLTQQVHAAEQNNDPLAEIRALDKLARLYGK